MHQSLLAQSTCICKIGARVVLHYGILGVVAVDFGASRPSWNLHLGAIQDRNASLVMSVASQVQPVDMKLDGLAFKKFDAPSHGMKIHPGHLEVEPVELGQPDSFW